MENQKNIGNQNTQQIGQNPVNQPVQVPQKPKFNLRVFSIISLFLILVVFSTIYLYRQNFNSLKNKKSVDTSVTENKVTGTNTSDTKVGWKAYNNPKFYYSFSYPSAYSLSESKNLPEDILQQVVIETNSDNPSNRKYFTISVKKAINLEEEVKNEKRSIEGHILVTLGKESRTAKDGLAGIQLDYEPIAGKEDLPPFTVIILGYEDTSFITSTINDYYSYVVQTNIDKLTYSQENPTLADEVFSTFKQLPRPPVQTESKIEFFSLSPSKTLDKSTWKTFTEKTHGFTIRFPSDWSTDTSKDDYGVQTLILSGPTKWINSGGGMNYPKLYIGSPFIYSSSGAICANQSCYKIGTLTVEINEKEFSTPILTGGSSGSIDKDIKSSLFYFYRLDFFKLNNLESKPVVTAEFGTKEQGQTIVDILSTITY